MSLWEKRFADFGRPIIIGHRGCNAARENSRVAFQLAIAAGADAVETDLWLTADGVAICRHDDHIRDGAGSEHLIEQTAWATVAMLEPSVPRFSDAGLKTRSVYLDIKQESLDLLERLELEAMRVDAIVGVQTLGFARKLVQRFPFVHQVALMAEDADILRLADIRPGAWMRLHQWRATRDLVSRYRDAGMRVMITCGEHGGPTGDISASGLAAILDLSPDAIIVNDVAAAVTALNRTRA